MLTSFFESVLLTQVILLIWLAGSAFVSPAVGKRGTLIAWFAIIILGGAAGSIITEMVS